MQPNVLFASKSEILGDTARDPATQTRKYEGET